MSSRARARFDKLLAVAVPVAGLLEATAIINIGETTGVPLAAATVPVLLLRLAYDRAAMARLWNTDRTFRLWARTLAVFLAFLWIGGGIHALGFSLNPSSQLSQCVSRSAWPIYLVAAYAFYRVTRREQTLLHTIVGFGILYVLYGFYDLIAQVFSLPRFLDWLRNNHSIYVSRTVGGWTGLPRISSLAGEPAFTTVPVMVFIAAAALRLQGWRRALALTLCLLFVIGTAARSQWLVVVATLLALLAAITWRKMTSVRFRSVVERPILLMFGAALPIALLTARLSIDATDSDYSVQERQEGTQVGYELFRAAPFFGQGFDAKNVYYRSYANHLLNYENVPSEIHNGFASYLSSLGAIGYLLFEIPIFLVIVTQGLGVEWRVYWVTVIIMSMQAGDFSWTTSFWAMLLFVALQPYFVKSLSRNTPHRPMRPE